jgi:hypothetical protein
MFEKYSSTTFNGIPSTRTDGRTDRYNEANSRVSQFDASNKKPFFVHFSQTQKLSILQEGNLVESRPSGVTLNQAAASKGIKSSYFFFETPIMGRELNREKNAV